MTRDRSWSASSIWRMSPACSGMDRPRARWSCFPACRWMCACLEKARWGTALNYFTGSLAHNVKMRQIALDQGLSLNEHALSPVDENKTIIESAKKILCDSEEKVYETLGLQYVPPELREDSGEIEAARAHRLPQLIQEQTSSPTCTCTQPGAMARTRSARWSKPAPGAVISTSSSPIIRAASASPMGFPSSACWRRRKKCADQRRDGRRHSSAGRHRNGHQSGRQPRLSR